MYTTLIILAPALVCMFWLILFLIDYRRSRTDKRIMFWFMLTGCFLYFGHSCYFSHQTSLIPISDVFYSYANLAIYPMYFLYVHYITTNRCSRLLVLVMLLPAIFIGVGNLLAYQLTDEETRNNFIRYYMYKGTAGCDECGFWLPALHDAARILFPIMVIICMYYGTRDIKRFNQSLDDYYSNDEQRNLRDAYQLMWFTLGSSVASITLNILNQAFFIDNQLMLTLPSLFFTAIYMLLGRDAYLRKFTAADMFNEMDVERTSLDEFGNASGNDIIHNPTPSASLDIARRLTALMTEEKIYLNPDLKITEVARRLKTNRNYTYYAITEHLKTSFSDYINSLRIKHAQEILQQTPDINLYELMAQCGYTSESTFFRNFKKVTGLTPKAWIDKNTDRRLASKSKK